jgi:hypothetical protein
MIDVGNAPPAAAHERVSQRLAVSQRPGRSAANATHAVPSKPFTVPMQLVTGHAVDGTSFRHTTAVIVSVCLTRKKKHYNKRTFSRRIVGDFERASHALAGAQTLGTVAASDHQRRIDDGRRCIERASTSGRRTARRVAAEAGRRVVVALTCGALPSAL